VKAVILVGGQGKRLRPLTFAIPKPLLPVGEKPVLQLIIEQLRNAGLCDLVLATGHQAELIRAFCGDGSRFGVSIAYVHEQIPLGTAGPLDLAREHLRDEELFLLMNGDIIAELDFRRFLEAAREAACDLTVAYTKYRYRSPYGVLSIAGDSIQGIVEKPEQEFSISAGIYGLRPAALDFVPQGIFFTIPDLIHRLLAAGRSVHAYPLEGYWIGLESVEHFDEALRRLEGVP
jgi:NDP-sugar pyrophosphorylase family protein